ncbi:MAG: GNAT family N-acetyltransferase [Firmicutes bacterium]|nr:GNAT family N-acetyltransferase [Bacillota bacterium]MBQ5794769.1 GNAT family N-acetyltransferase [Kiritimatiellia bacterium]
MIRKIEEKDREFFLAMTKEFYESDAVCYRIPEEYRTNTFDELMRSDTYAEAFIFEEDEKQVGYALIGKTWSQECGGVQVWIDEIMVIPEYRNQGLTTEFFSYIEKAVPAARYRLETEPENEAAARLYKRMGYEFCPYVQWFKMK